MLLKLMYLVILLSFHYIKYSHLILFSRKKKTSWWLITDFVPHCFTEVPANWNLCSANLWAVCVVQGGQWSSHFQWHLSSEKGFATHSEWHQWARVPECEPHVLDSHHWNMQLLDCTQQQNVAERSGIHSPGQNSRWNHVTEMKPYFSVSKRSQLPHR